MRKSVVSAAWCTFPLELTSMDGALFLPLLWLMISSINRFKAPLLEDPLQRAVLRATPLLLLLSGDVCSGWAELHISTCLMLLVCFVGNSGVGEKELWAQWGIRGWELTTSEITEGLWSSSTVTVLWRSAGGAASASSTIVVMTESGDFSKPFVAHLQNTHTHTFKTVKGCVNKNF